MRNALRHVWRALRTLTGDDAYERYLAHHLARHGDTPPLGRAEFFRLEQERRWSGGPNRCC